MQDNDLRTIVHIDNVLSRYEADELSLREMQADINAYSSVLEGKDCVNLVERLENLDGDIELLLYTESERNREKKAKKLVAEFRSTLKEFVAQLKSI